LVPFVGRQADRLTLLAAFHFNAANAANRIAIAGLGIGWTETSNIEADFQVTNFFGLPSPAAFVRDNYILCGKLNAPFRFGIELLEEVGRNWPFRMLSRQNNGGRHVAPRPLTGDFQSLNSLKPFLPGALQICQVVLCTLACQSDLWRSGFASAQGHDPVLGHSDAGCK